MKYFIFICILIFDLSLLRVYCYIRLKADKKKGQNNVSGNSNVKKFFNVLKFINDVLMLSSLLRLNLFIISYIPSHTIRNFLYRHVFLVKMAKNSVIYYGAEIRSPWLLEIGEGSIIGDKAILDARNGIKIANNVNFSTGVQIWTEQHGVNNMDFSCEGQGYPVIIENRCWCGPRTTILPGKTMKEGSVLAAGAVLTKDTEPFSINAGVPAKKIGERNRNINYELKGNRLHFL